MLNLFVSCLVDNFNHLHAFFSLPRHRPRFFLFSFGSPPPLDMMEGIIEGYTRPSLKLIALHHHLSVPSQSKQNALRLTTHAIVRNCTAVIRPFLIEQHRIQSHIHKQEYLSCLLLRMTNDTFLPPSSAVFRQP